MILVKRCGASSHRELMQEGMSQPVNSEQQRSETCQSDLFKEV